MRLSKISLTVLALIIAIVLSSCGWRFGVRTTRVVTEPDGRSHVVTEEIVLGSIRSLPIGASCSVDSQCKSQYCKAAKEGGTKRFCVFSLPVHHHENVVGPNGNPACTHDVDLPGYGYRGPVHPDGPWYPIAGPGVGCVGPTYPGSTTAPFGHGGVGTHVVSPFDPAARAAQDRATAAQHEAELAAPKPAPPPLSSEEERYLASRSDMGGRLYTKWPEPPGGPTSQLHQKWWGYFLDHGRVDTLGMQRIGQDGDECREQYHCGAGFICAETGVPFASGECRRRGWKPAVTPPVVVVQAVPATGSEPPPRAEAPAVPPDHCDEVETFPDDTSFGQARLSLITEGRDHPAVAGGSCLIDEHCQGELRCWRAEECERSFGVCAVKDPFNGEHVSDPDARYPLQQPAPGAPCYTSLHCGPVTPFCRRPTGSPNETPGHCVASATEGEYPPSGDRE